MPHLSTYPGWKAAQLLLDRSYPPRDAFSSRPMSPLPPGLVDMPDSFTAEEVIVARSTFKLNREDGAPHSPIAPLQNPTLCWCPLVGEISHPPKPQLTAV